LKFANTVKSNNLAITQTNLLCQRLVYITLLN